MKFMTFDEQYNMTFIVSCRRNFSSKFSFNLLIILLNYLQKGKLCVWYKHYFMFEKICIYALYVGEVAYMFEKLLNYCNNPYKNQKQFLRI
jgi:hypothetical protein